MLFCLFQTASQILSSPVLNHALLFVNKSSADFKGIYSSFNSAAEEFRLKVHTHTHAEFFKKTALQHNFVSRLDFSCFTSVYVGVNEDFVCDGECG